MAPTDEMISRIVGIARTGEDNPDRSWHREAGFFEGEQRPCIIFGSSTWPSHRCGIYVDSIIAKLSEYEQREIGGGI